MNFLTLVNKEQSIKDSWYKYLELVDYKDMFGKDIKIEKNTLEAYLKLESFLKTKGIYVAVESAYRTVYDQQAIIDDYAVRYNDDYIRQYVAPIRTSEHHTGLAVDLSPKIEDKYINDIDDLLANESIFLEIHKYLADFGFILRYPKGKENITGYSYEPWHIRYVGVVPANIMYKNNLTLEEYLTNFSGVLVVNKEKGVTSRDVVNDVSKILGIKKIGHTGTLDPLAEGVLILTIGRATKIGELLTSYYKEYIASVEVGKLTDTLDITGQVLKQKELNKRLDYNKICSSFRKKYLQEVPVYSAVKVDGKKLYEYARENKDVILPKKEVNIKEIELLTSSANIFKFRTLVSKGTYIRSLIRDMGNSVSEYFCMSDLIRTKQGDFSIDSAYTLEEIRNNKFKILTLEEVLIDYPIINIEDEILLKKINNGCRVDNIYNISDKVLFKYDGVIIAIYQKDGDVLKVWKMI